MKFDAYVTRSTPRQFVLVPAGQPVPSAPEIQALGELKLFKREKDSRNGRFGGPPQAVIDADLTQRGFHICSVGFGFEEEVRPGDILR